MARGGWRVWVVLACVIGALCVGARGEAGTKAEKTWHVQERLLLKKWKHQTVNLNLTTIDQVFTRGERWLVEFYSVRCIYCQKFSQNYEIAGRRLAQESIITAKVESTDARVLLTRFKIRNYPSFLLIDEKNKVYQFSGDEYSVQGLVDFAKDRTNSEEVVDLWFGPRSPLWFVAMKMAIFTHSLWVGVHEGKLTPRGIVLSTMGIMLSTVLLFLVALHISTTPPRRKKRD